MTALAELTPDPFTSPLDIVEHSIFSREWAYDRPNDEELVAEVPGQWTDVRVWCSWQSDIDALLFSCGFGAHVPDPSNQAMHTLLALVNERMWLGHFELSQEDRSISYRYTLLVAEPQETCSPMVESILDVALEECQRFYPAFQSVFWGGKSPQEALELAMFETVGEA